MNTKSIIWVFMIIGSTLGGIIPSLWGSGVFSMWSVLFTAIGGLFGIWAGFKMNNW